MTQWDEIVYAFCMGIPAKKHRKRLKVYTDCFTGRKATDWMHNYLMYSSYFSKHEVSRFQSVQLLRKFAHHNIIERIDIRTDEKDVCEFNDDRSLYRLTKSVTNALPINQPLPDQQDVGDDLDDIAMDIEAEPVPPVMPPLRSLDLNTGFHLTNSSPSLNCCYNRASMDVTIRSPLKPANRFLSKSGNVNRTTVSSAKIRKLPEETFWL